MIPPLARDRFALEPHVVYLNHAAIGVVPIATRDAVRAYADAHAATGVVGVAAYEMRLPRYRARLAEFLDADPRGAALLRNTSEAANILARGLALRPDDEVLLGDNEFGSNALPWLALRETGVRVRLLETARERLTPEVLRREMTARTKVVAVSWVSFFDGFRHDLGGLAEIAHAGGALLAVDAIQGVGAYPFSMRGFGVDAVYGGAQKWLLGMPGLGYLCVTQNLLDRLRVHLPGWRSLADIWNFLDYEQPYIDDATRFEAGTANLVGAAALHASLDVLAAADVSAIGAHVDALRARLVSGLESRGARVAGPAIAGATSGICTFTLPGRDPLEIGRRLADAGIVTTNRASGIRVSPHGYNTFAEIDALLEILPGA